MISEKMKNRIKDIYKNNPDNYHSTGSLKGELRIFRCGENSIEELMGKTVIEIDGAESESEHIFIKCSDDSVYIMYHEQDCCESIQVEDICGDLNALLNSPITMAESVTECSDKDDENSYTYTFYKLATVKGYVTIRWYGESNGYYSEDVDFLYVGKEGYEHD